MLRILLNYERSLIENIILYYPESYFGISLESDRKLSKGIHQMTVKARLLTIKGIITSCLPKQWVKNIFVLAPLVFFGYFTELDSITASFLAVLLFSTASSAVYIVNDLHDIEHDKHRRRHPVFGKRQNPPIW